MDILLHTSVPKISITIYLKIRSIHHSYCEDIPLGTSFFYNVFWNSMHFNYSHWMLLTTASYFTIEIFHLCNSITNDSITPSMKEFEGEVCHNSKTLGIANKFDKVKKLKLVIKRGEEGKTDRGTWLNRNVLRPFYIVTCLDCICLMASNCWRWVINAHLWLKLHYVVFAVVQNATMVYYYVSLLRKVQWAIHLMTKIYWCL